MFTSLTLLCETGKLLYCRHKVDLNPSGFLPYSGQEDRVYCRNWKPLVETYIYTKVESVTTEPWMPTYSELTIQKTTHLEEEKEE